MFIVTRLDPVTAEPRDHVEAEVKSEIQADVSMDVEVDEEGLDSADTHQPKTPLRRSTRTRKPPDRLSPSHFVQTVQWKDKADYMKSLLSDCTSENTDLCKAILDFVAKA